MSAVSLEVVFGLGVLRRLRRLRLNTIVFVVIVAHCIVDRTQQLYISCLSTNLLDSGAVSSEQRGRLDLALGSFGLYLDTLL